METIQNILGLEYLKRFKIYHDATLFPPNWEALKVGRCPLCSCKLKTRRDNKIKYCKSVKHGKPFVIQTKTFDLLLNKANRPRAPVEARRGRLLRRSY